MYFALILSTISAFTIPNYRTKFYSSPPSNFNRSNYLQTKIYNLGNDTYTCYFAPENNPHTDQAPDQYLKSKLLNKCYDITHTGYWFFTFCPFKNLIQYRFDDNGVHRIDLFTLGKEDSNQYDIIERGVATNWTNGDTCVVDKKPRKTRVEYICDLSNNDDGKLTSISEPNYCQYLVKFHTQHACAFPNMTHESLTDIVCISNTNSTIEGI